ncbi:SufE family protein [Pseudobdellovibrio sp. HCB154]|uniref:SufE family protein n=1 Tax=Pseudobdellovibrio sp. HCB154 TaxID=3386277 RepID=UPI0039174202
MSIEVKAQEMVAKFSNINDWELKYEKLIELGKAWPGIPEELKTEDLKVKGCQSQVWIKAELKDGKVYFIGDSDAIIVRGLVALVLSVYSGQTPSDIMKYDASFLKDIGLDSGLSPSRTNGLYSMIKQIKYYATAFAYLLSKQ